MMPDYEMEQLICDYGKDLFRFCVHLTGDKSRAEDLYQDTFVHILKIRNRLDSGNNIKSYLMGIALNLYRNEQRKEKRRARIAPAEDYENAIISVADQNANPVRHLLQSEAEELLFQAVRMLPEKQRITILLYYSEELSVKEISRILHIPKGTVLSRLSAARKQLKKTMEGYDYEEGYI